MKKLCLFLVLLLVVFFVACPKPDDPDDPGGPTPTPGPNPIANADVTGLQYALYNSGTWTPIYSVTQGSLIHDAWTHVEIPVDASNIGYDGFTGGVSIDPAQWTSLDRIRIQAVTSAAEQELLVYIDNLLMTDGFTTVVDQPYASSTGSFWLSKGIALADNSTIQTVATQSCLQVHATTADASGSIGVEFQDNLTASTDCSGEQYVISFDYYLPANLP